MSTFKSNTPRRAPLELRAIPQVPPTGQVRVSAADAKPATGSNLRQLFGLSKIQALVREQLGVFNPRYIGLETRLLMRDDPTVAFGLAILRAPIINGKWDVDSNDPQIEAFVRQVLRRKYHQLATGGSLSVPFGYQPIEKVWGVTDEIVEVDDKSTGTVSKFTVPNAWVFDEFKALDPRTINMLIDPDTDKWAGFEQRPVTLAPQPNDTPRIGTERCFLWTYRREEVWGRLQGYPQLNQCYVPWWSKAATNLFCDRYFERKAEPGYKAHAPAEIIGPNGEKIDGFAFMGSQLQALKNGEAIILPGEFDEKGNRIVDIEYLQDDKRGDMFQQRLDSLDLQILKGLWIPDRTGASARGGSGIGSGEASVHYEMLQRLVEQVSVEWFREVQEQVVNPLVLYNFGEQRLKESRTRICSSGISDFHRDLMKTVLAQMAQAEVALKDGKVVRLMEYIDAVEICEELGLPIKRADQLGPLAHKRVDPGAPDGSNMPTGNPGDTNVKEKGGAKPGQNTKASLDAINGLRAELQSQRVKDQFDARVKDLEDKQERERQRLLDQIERVADKERVALAAERAKAAAAPAQAPQPPMNVSLHTHLGDVTLPSMPPAQVVINQGDVNVKAGDVNASLTLKPGDKKTATITGPDGSVSKVDITPIAPSTPGGQG